MKAVPLDKIDYLKHSKGARKEPQKQLNFCHSLWHMLQLDIIFATDMGSLYTLGNVTVWDSFVYWKNRFSEAMFFYSQSGAKLKLNHLWTWKRVMSCFWEISQMYEACGLILCWEAHTFRSMCVNSIGRKDWIHCWAIMIGYTCTDTSTHMHNHTHTDSQKHTWMQRIKFCKYKNQV
jgi:hypothetical protein